jgi:hypothetical protein
MTSAAARLWNQDRGAILRKPKARRGRLTSRAMQAKNIHAKEVT